MLEKIKNKTQEEYDRIQKGRLNRMLEKKFVINGQPKKSLEDLLKSRIISKVDPRITTLNVPNINRLNNFIIQGIPVARFRESYIEYLIEDLDKNGLRLPTLYEFLEFLPKMPGVLGGIYIMGNIVDIGQDKFCIRVLRDGNQYEISLHKLQAHLTKNGGEKYWTPKYSQILAVSKK